MKAILTLLFFITAGEAFCQMGYREGLIVTQQDDTISCFVPIETSFGDKILIKRTKDGNTEKMLLKDIKYVATSTNAYENVGYVYKGKEQHKLMWMEIEGKINLYLEIENKVGRVSTTTVGGTFSTFEPVKTYVIKKADSTYLIDEKNFIDCIKPIVEDNPGIIAKLGNGYYNYANIEELVTKYNE